MHERCEREVVELHRFFGDWFTGRLPLDDDAFARVADALAPDFELVSPRGLRDSRSSILDAIHRAHSGRPADFSVWVQQVRPRWSTGEVCLVTYEEWQSEPTGARGRVSSALFRAEPSAPLGVQWVHLHETWLPTGEDDTPFLAAP